MLEPLHVWTDPRRAGPYVLLARTGSSGFGPVFLGRAADGRVVEVTVLPVLDEETRRLLPAFVTAMARVGGELTTRVVDADATAPRPWVAAEHTPGLLLPEAVERYGALPQASVAALGAGLAEALRDVHAAGLLHGDLRPASVLLTAGRPRLSGYGFAVALPATDSGEPGFMPPEQCRGERPGEPGDVFSLGAVLVLAATAQGPYGSVPPRRLVERTLGEEPRLDAVPDGLRPLLRRCLARDPADRPALPELVGACGELADRDGTDWLPPALTAVLREKAADPGVPKRPTATRRQALVGITASAAVVAGAIAAVRAASEPDAAERARESLEAGRAPRVMASGEARYSPRFHTLDELPGTVHPTGDDGRLRGPYFELYMNSVQITDRLPPGEGYAWGFGAHAVEPAAGQELVLASFGRDRTGGPWKADRDEARKLIEVGVRTAAGRRGVPGVYAPDLKLTNVTAEPGVLLACVPRDGRAWLEVTAQGRTQSMDLRTGRHGTDVVPGYERPLPKGTFTGPPYDATVRVSAYRVTRRARLAVDFGTAWLTRTPWLPSLGWARKGRAWLITSLDMETWLDDPGRSSTSLSNELQETARTFPLTGRIRCDRGFTLTSGGETYRPVLDGAVDWRYWTVPQAKTAVVVFDVPLGRRSGTLEFRPDVTLTGRFRVGGTDTDVPVTWESRFPARRLSLTLR